MPRDRVIRNQLTSSQPLGRRDGDPTFEQVVNCTAGIAMLPKQEAWGLECSVRGGARTGPPIKAEV